jgi:aspartate racemase
MNQQTLGLIGGLGVRAGIYYYEKLAQAHESRNTALRMFLAHADVRKCMGHVAVRQTLELADYLSGLIQSLAAAGAQVAVIPAVTPHICIEEVTALSPIPLVSILRALNERLEERKVQRVALFGTRYTIESGLFGALTSVEVITPADREIAEIHRVYTDYAVQGVAREGHREALERIASALIKREKLDAILLAGTDLSAFYDGHPPEYPAIDASDIHIDAIMHALLREEGPNPSRSRV